MGQSVMTLSSRCQECASKSVLNSVYYYFFNNHCIHRRLKVKYNMEHCLETEMEEVNGMYYFSSHQLHEEFRAHCSYRVIFLAVCASMTVDFGGHSLGYVSCNYIA